jgi:hypothetical protein
MLEDNAMWIHEMNSEEKDILPAVSRIFYFWNPSRKFLLGQDGRKLLMNEPAGTCVAESRSGLLGRRRGRHLAIKVSNDVVQDGKILTA